MRQRIAEYCEAQSPYLGGSRAGRVLLWPEKDSRQTGSRGRQQDDCIWRIQAYGHVYTEIVPDARKKTLLAVIRGRVDLGSVIHTDGWRAYDGLVDVGYERHFRVHYGANEFAVDNRHILMVLNLSGPSRNYD